MSARGFVVGGALIAGGSALLLAGLRPPSTLERVQQVVRWNPPEPRVLSTTKRSALDELAGALNALRDAVRKAWTAQAATGRSISLGLVTVSPRDLRAALDGPALPWPQLDRAWLTATYRTDELGRYESDQVGMQLQRAVAVLDTALVTLGHEDLPEMMPPEAARAAILRLLASPARATEFAALLAAGRGLAVRAEQARAFEVCAEHRLRSLMLDEMPGAHLSPEVGRVLTWLRYHSGGLVSGATAEEMRLARRRLNTPCRPARTVEV